MFVIQIYKKDFRNKTEYAVSEQQAKAVADKHFAKGNVYKVRVYKDKAVPVLVGPSNLIYCLRKPVKQD